MLGYVLTQGSSLTSNQDLGIKVATPFGMSCDQLLFGWLSEWLANVCGQNGCKVLVSQDMKDSTLVALVHQSS